MSSKVILIIAGILSLISITLGVYVISNGMNFLDFVRFMNPFLPF